MWDKLYVAYSKNRLPLEEGQRPLEYVASVMNCSQRTAQKQLAHAAVRANRQMVTDHAMPRVAGSVGSRWPEDCSDLARRIDMDRVGCPRVAGYTTDRDRQLLAKYMPVGSLTRSDGSSVADYVLQGR